MRNKVLEVLLDSVPFDGEDNATQHMLDGGRYPELTVHPETGALDLLPILRPALIALTVAVHRAALAHDVSPAAVVFDMRQQLAHIE